MIAFNFYSPYSLGVPLLIANCMPLFLLLKRIYPCLSQGNSKDTEALTIVSILFTNSLSNYSLTSVNIESAGFLISFKSCWALGTKKFKTVNTMMIVIKYFISISPKIKKPLSPRGCTFPIGKTDASAQVCNI